MAWTVETDSAAHCLACGGSLTTRDTHEGERPYCDECEVTYYRNPVPMARATVVDGRRALLIVMGEGRDEGEWALPGGHCRERESPRVAAARELGEETGLSVDPGDLELVGDGHLQFEDGGSMVSFNYAAPLEAASGTVAAASDADAARFWSRAELDQLRPGPSLRASGVAQVRSAITTVGDG